MSSTGGGLRLRPQDQAVAPTSDFSKTLTLKNGGSSEIDLSQADIDALAAQYCPDPYQYVGLTYDGSAWSVTTDPS